MFWPERATVPTRYGICTLVGISQLVLLGSRLFSSSFSPLPSPLAIFYSCSTKESAIQPKLPAWTSQEGYDSDFTAVTAASRTSPERSNDLDISVSKADISRRQRVYNNKEARGQGVYNNEAVSGQGVYNSEELREASLGRLGGTRSPAAAGDRERQGERNRERWKSQEERGVCERRREGDTNFSRAQRYGCPGFCLSVPK